jgi:hypothetical protein
MKKALCALECLVFPCIPENLEIKPWGAKRFAEFVEKERMKSGYKSMVLYPRICFSQVICFA